ncbi:hypothetical protein BaRGS_00030000, partial [Batillaria attramentaria]
IMAGHKVSFMQPPKGMSLPTCTLLFLAAIFLLAAQAHAQTSQDNTVSGSSASQSQSVLTNALREVLSDRGMSDEEIDDVLFSVGARLLHMTSFSKRISGWKRIPIQTRFAPFGTKLVPSRTYGDSSGSTLLRYGRSVAQ